MKVYSPSAARTATVVHDGGTQSDLIGDPPAGRASAVCGVRDVEMWADLFADPAAVARARRRLSVDRPCLRPADDDQEGGRGLHLVDYLADRWGVAPGPLAGKTVWLELDVDVAVWGAAS
ncbi:ATP-binding protein [Streptomyces sp. NPDC004658]|uniref:ATP-binding protein n=1 Tax=Streptomyces sp. NPDC004658 TaxID=3154672 RepID=UPI0033B118B9